MPNEPQNQPVVVVPDPATNNPAVAAQLAAQDAAGHSTAGKPSDFAPVESALDQLAAEAQKKIEAAAAAAAQPAITPAAQPAAQPAVQPPASTPPAKTPEELAAEAAAKDKADLEAAAVAEAQKRAADVFKDVPGLPPGGSVKASEAWNALKEAAAKEVLDRDTKIAELAKQNAELTQRVNTPTTQQLEAEKQMKDLNEWRAKLDLQFDPRFKEFDKQVSNIHDFIYDILGKRPDVVTPEVIAEIKKFGGPENCNLTELFAKLKDPALQRIVESKVSDALLLNHNKDKAIKETEANLGEYVKQRAEYFQNATTAHTSATKASLEPMLSKLEWFTPKVDDVEGKKFVDDIKGQLAEALRDDSPQMRAILLTGFAQMCHLQNVEKGLRAELATTKASLADAQGMLDRIKNSSTSRLRESAASPGAQPAPPPPQNQFTTRAADALDSIAQRVLAERAAKGAA